MTKRKRNSVTLVLSATLASGAFGSIACDKDVDLGGDPAADSGEAGASSVAGAGGSGGGAGALGKGGAAGATSGAGGVAGSSAGSAGQGVAGGLTSVCEPDAMGEVRFTVAELCSFHDCPETVAEAFASMSDLCDDGIVEMTLCNGLRSVVLNGGLAFNAYAFDVETEELVGVVLGSDIPFGPCNFSSYTAGVGWNRCSEAQSCDCSACPSCSGEGGAGGAAGFAGASGVAGASSEGGGSSAEAVAGPCVP